MSIKYDVFSVTKAILDDIPPNKFATAPPAPFKRRGAVVYRERPYPIRSPTIVPEVNSTEYEPVQTNPTFIPPPISFTNSIEKEDEDEIDDGEDYDAALQDIGVEIIPAAPAAAADLQQPEGDNSGIDVDEVMDAAEQHANQVHDEVYGKILDSFHSNTSTQNIKDSFIEKLDGIKDNITKSPDEKSNVEQIDLTQFYNFDNTPPSDPAPEPPLSDSDGNDTDDDIFI